MTRVHVPVFAILVTVALPACSTDPAAEITAENIGRDVMALSADSMEGRGAGTVGENRAARYISTRFEAMGLAPVGDDYLLPVELVGLRKNAGQSSLTLRGPEGTLPYTDNETLTYWSTARREAVDLDDVPVVFVGYGVEAPEYGWDDYKGEELDGKVLLFLNNDPPVTEDGDDLFGGPARTYYGRWTYKFEQAMLRGAAGAIVIHTTESASYPFSVIGNTGTRQNWARDYRLDLLAWIDSTSAERIAESMGTTLSGLFAMAAEREFRPLDTRFRVTAHIETAISRVEANNVAGMVEGSDPALRDQHIVFTAHYDHLGVNPSAEGGDTIFNGAWDNAAGTAAIMNLAEAFAAAGPRRSVMFLAVTAEEGGILGSGAFVENPPIPLHQIVANVNVDMPQIFGPTHDIAAIGLVTNTLGDALRQVAEEQGLRAKGDPNPNAGSFYRSDQVSFAKAGIPALYLQPGNDYIEPPAVDPAEYRRAHYHQPADEVDEAWNFEGMARDMRVLFRAVLRAADADEQPRWVSGNEFEEEWKALYGRE